MDAQTGFARAIAEAARTRNQRRSLENTLQTIVEVACNSVPGFEQVGIATLRKDGTVETKAATGDLVRNLTPPPDIGCRGGRLLDDRQRPLRSHWRSKQQMQRRCAVDGDRLPTPPLRHLAGLRSRHDTSHQDLPMK